jgi:glyoxylase-like metal-dependent hydrolase (beta-lactamase superfamily II)
MLKYNDLRIYSGKFGVNTTIFCKLNIAVDPNVGKNVYDGVRKVFITHGHADHFGDALFLEGSVKILAPRHETPLIENPEINWRGMYSWAKLPECVVTPYFLGRGVRVDEFSDGLTGEVKSIPMPGHTPAHTAYLVDGVLVAGDAIHSPEYWKKFGILYYTDPDAMADSLKNIVKEDWDLLIPGHGEVFNRKEGIKAINTNLRMLEKKDREIYDIVKAGGDDGIVETEIIAELASRYNFKSVKAILVTMPPVRGHISSMCERGILELFENEGKIKVRATKPYRRKR